METITHSLLGAAAAEVGIRFFGGSHGIGAVRPLGSAGKWRFGLRGGVGL